MKTKLEEFLIEKNLRDEFAQEFERYHKTPCEFKHDTGFSMTSYSFVWDQSERGHDFWRDLDDEFQAWSEEKKEPSRPFTTLTDGKTSVSFKMPPLPNDTVELANTPKPKHDPVNNPAHYSEGREYEPIKVAEDWGLDKDAYLFNAFKYISRAGRKGSMLQDLEKSRWFLDRRIQRLKDTEGGEG